MRAPWQERRAVWHKWFAWHPITIKNGRLVWLSNVWRRMTDIDSWSGYYEYSNAGSQPGDGERTAFLTRYGFSWESLRRNISRVGVRTSGTGPQDAHCVDCLTRENLVFLLSEQDAFRCQSCADKAKWGTRRPHWAI